MISAERKYKIYYRKNYKKGIKNQLKDIEIQIKKENSKLFINYYGEIYDENKKKLKDSGYVVTTEKEKTEYESTNYINKISWDPNDRKRFPRPPYIKNTDRLDKIFPRKKVNNCSLPNKKYPIDPPNNLKEKEHSDYNNENKKE